MQNGLPSVTTSIGAEGMHCELPWGGSVVDTPEKIASKAVELYENEGLWMQSQKYGVEIINSIYCNKEYQVNFIATLKSLFISSREHRTSNFIGAMLMHHTLKSTKYLSKWIGEKEKIK